MNIKNLINKKILIALALIASISSMKLLSVKIDPKTGKEIVASQKMPTTKDFIKDIIELQGDIKKEIDSMTKNLKKGALATKNVEAILKLVNEKMPIIKLSLTKILNKMREIQGAELIQFLGEVTGVKPKIDNSISNIEKAINNIEIAITYILKDLQVPTKEVTDLISKIKETGVFDLFESQKK